MNLIVSTAKNQRELVWFLYTYIIENLFKYMDLKLPRVTCTSTSKSSKTNVVLHLYLETVIVIFLILWKDQVMYLPPSSSFEWCQISRTQAFECWSSGGSHWGVWDWCLISILSYAGCLHSLRSFTSRWRSTAIFLFEKGPDQIGALRKYIDGMLDKCSKILSVAGRVHIQYPESNHALMALGRPMDNTSIMTYGCFIGDIIGFFEILN